ncbi:hypothetical protein LOTGIDRAFT_113895 [Lottia gigantea]|uniref:Ig-like domain-containing protein n=1 Tax=Lottia gigantea TaxID=225164 RepID=V4AV62_LOTGI|nr:hypothetical protein LOTGIDRAFT_113895 [Lottia gigantea]ESO98840.1 hypothetical protein LOTGIDRAFT_113895 [Lottia gigantea]
MFLSPDQVLISYGTKIVEDTSKYSVTQISTNKYKLQVKNIQPSDQGIYRCLSRRQPTRKIVLSLVESTSILEFGSTGDLQVTEGDDGRFYCNVTGYPRPNITWYYTRDSDSPDQLSMFYISVKLEKTGPELILKDTQKSMAGKYSCMADNGYPPFSSLDMFLSVDFSPVISLPNTHVGQILERDVILECTVQAEPFPEVFWSHEGKRIPSDGERVYIDVYQDTVDTMTLSLNIRDLTKEDLGIYTCSASNDIGTSVKHLKLYGKYVYIIYPYTINAHCLFLIFKTIRYFYHVSL